jgi:hypothetical protein
MPPHGAELIVMGTNNTNTVTFTLNDADYGCLINGSATLTLGKMIVLIYNKPLKRFIEKSRNL